MNADDDDEVAIDLSDLDLQEFEAEQQRQIAEWQAKQAEREAEAEAKAEAESEPDVEVEDEVEEEQAEMEEEETWQARRDAALDRVTLGDTSYAVEEWRFNYEFAVDYGDSDELKRLRKMALKGDITDGRGQRLDGAALSRMRNRLLGTYDHLPSGSFYIRLRRQPTQEDRRWLIRDLWPWGTKPMLGGNKGAGKTTVATDLVLSLIIPGRKFLNYFEVPEVPDEDFGAGIWLINAETPAEDVDRSLSRELGEGVGWELSDWVHVEHLQEDFGGAHMFDLTNREIYQLWFDRLNECEACDGRDDQPPFALIVDGLTAILGGSTVRYGEWYAKFRELMYALDIPNAMVVVHNTMAGAHPLGGVEAAAGADGVWTYSSDNPDNPFSKRRFSVRPRLGGIAISPTEVTLGDDGLTLHRGNGRSSSPDQVPEADPSGEVPVAEAQPQLVPTTEEVLAYVRGCNAQGHGPSHRQIRENVTADNVEVDAVTAELVKDGLLEIRPRKGRGGGNAYWVKAGIPPS